MTLPAPPFASCFSASNFKLILKLATAIFFLSTFQACSGAYYGKPLGKLTEFHHGVSGKVFAVDSRTLLLKDFTYDGEGPAAYFYAGNSKGPIINGFRVRDERGTHDLLRRYRKEDVTLTLPEGKTLANIKWFAIWCDDFSVNFGDVKIPRGFDYPKPQKLGPLKGIHGVSSEPVVVVDAQTLLIPGFSYDGEAPDAKFWVGTGPNPTPQGIKIPDENGKVAPLRKYDHKTIVLTLPGDLTVHQIGHFGVWCEAFTVDFGHVQIPESLNVPPSLKMLGVSPQSKLNCEVLHDDLAFEVRWAVAGDSVVVQLVAKLDGTQYMSFGVSTDPKKSVMIGGDIVVAWVDKQTLQGYAVDYFLDAKSQCSGQRGSCPDTRIQENANSVRLLNAAMVNGYSIVTYQRPLKATDELDVPITTNGSQAIIWAIGPLNERKEVSFHSDYLKKDQLIEFGRPPRWNCPMPDSQDQDLQNRDKDNEGAGQGSSQETSVTTRRPQRVPPTPAPAPKTGAWEIPPIQCNEPEDGVFYAQMGPTGGKHGYPAITGHVGWGISWYINGLLIPEINVVRGKKYTFIVEGGSDPETPARYHPFYITDDPIGGYQHKTPEEKENIKIFAGVKKVRGTTKLTGVGRLCNWVPDQSKPLADEFTSFGAYQRTLTLECDHGEPGVVEWTPDQDTPDTVYYHCYTHRHLGWKINVHDECDATEGAASEVDQVYAELSGHRETSDMDLEGLGSVRVSSKVTPGPEFFQDHQEYIRNPSFIANTAYTAGKDSSITQLIRPNNPIFDSYQRFQSFEDRPGAFAGPGQSSSSSYNEMNRNSLKNNNHNNKYSHHNHHHHHMLINFTHNKNSPSSLSSSSPSSSQGQGQMKMTKKENANPITSYEVRERERDKDVNESLNYRQKLITDTRKRGNHLTPNANNGMNFAYPQGTPPIAFTRPDKSHLAQVVRRPLQNRRPIQSSVRPSPPITHISNPAIPMPQQRTQIFMERKKPIYRVTSSPYHNNIISMQNGKRLNTQINKLTKHDYNQNTIIESKMSQASSTSTPKRQHQHQHPAKNTGFKPESVVVEGGFKPIIRITDVTRYAEDRRFDVPDEEFLPENTEYHSSSDNFEPMFIPSPPDRNESKKLRKKAQLQGQVHRNKPRLEDNEDMETAADRLDAYYLPPASIPAGSVISPKPMGQEPSDGALVTADGTQVLDANLARSIPRVGERMRSRVSSHILSRTPQFGQFRGELPPPIPGNIRPEMIPQLNNARQFSANADLPSGNAPPVKSQGNTRLTLVQRSKRSPHHVPGHDRDDGQNITDSIVTNAQVTPTNEGNNRGVIVPQEYSEDHDHKHGHVHDHDHAAVNATKSNNDHQDSTAPSAGEFVLANIQYIILTVVLYFVI